MRNTYKIEGLEKIEQEEQLHSLYIHLFNDILNCSDGILRKVEEKYINIGKEQGFHEVYEQVINSIKEYAMSDPDFNDNYLKIIDDAKLKLSATEKSD